MHALQIGTVAISFISLLLVLISLGTSYWRKAGGLHEGLWTSCYFSTCVAIENSPANFNAIRVLMLLGMIAGAVSFFCLCDTSFFGLCATFCCSSDSMAKISAIVSFVAGVCTMIAMSIYTYEFSLYYGWSFALGWFTFPLYLITCGLAYKAFASE